MTEAELRQLLEQYRIARQTEMRRRQAGMKIEEQADATCFWRTEESDQLYAEANIEFSHAMEARGRADAVVLALMERLA